MKTIIVMRHAKSSWDNAYLADHDRPLKKRGKRDAPRMGQILVASNLLPDLVISSSAKRALDTAEAVTLELGYENEILVTRHLYHADSQSIVEILREVSDQYSRIMIIGHNPGLEEFLEDLTGAWNRMPTAAIAVIDLPISRWKELDDDIEGELLNLWTPTNPTGVL